MYLYNLKYKASLRYLNIIQSAIDTILFNNYQHFPSTIECNVKTQYFIEELRAHAFFLVKKDVIIIAIKISDSVIIYHFVCNIQI